MTNAFYVLLNYPERCRLMRNWN